MTLIESELYIDEIADELEKCGRGDLVPHLMEIYKGYSAKLPSQNLTDDWFTKNYQ
jgi:hypothetical protein